jgi:hypothetical protein
MQVEKFRIKGNIITFVDGWRVVAQQIRGHPFRADQTASSIGAPKLATWPPT